MIFSAPLAHISNHGGLKVEHNGQNLENVVYHSETTALCLVKAGWPASDPALDLGSDDACQRNIEPVKLGDSSVGYTHGCRVHPWV